MIPILENQYVAPWGAWSANGEYAFVVSDQNQLNVLELPSGTKTSVDITNGDSVHSFRWIDDRRVGFVTETGIFAYDVLSETIELIYQLPEGANVASYQYSPSGKYFAVAMNGVLYLMDQQTNTLTEFQSVDEIYNPSSFPQFKAISDFQWHPTLDWLITFSSYPRYLLNILDAQTGLQRELTLCYNEPSCFGWLQ